MFCSIPCSRSEKECVRTRLIGWFRSKLVTGLINLSYLGIDLAVATQTSALEAKLNFAYNIFDTPMLLLFFYYAASGKKRKNHILLSMFPRVCCL